MDVLALAKGLQQPGILGNMRQHAQFYLRIVGPQQQPPLFGYKGPPHLAALFGANGNVLQVGVAGADPSGDGASLPERGVYSPRGRVH